MRTLHFQPLLLLTFFCLVSSPTQAQFGGLFGGGPKIETIKTETLYGMISKHAQAVENAQTQGVDPPEADFVVVDVRSDAEVNVSIIEGAITKAEFEKNTDKYQGRLVIPYCTVGGRSAAYSKKLLGQGMTVKNYEGSILKWIDAGLPLVTLDGQPTRRVHVYSDRYSVPAPYEKVTQ